MNFCQTNQNILLKINSYIVANDYRIIVTKFSYLASMYFHILFGQSSLKYEKKSFSLNKFILVKFK